MSSSVGHVGRLIGLALVVVCAACADDATSRHVSTRYDAAFEDGGAEAGVLPDAGGVDGNVDTGVDAATPPMDAAVADAAMGSMDASFDAASTSSMDAAVGSDASANASASDMDAGSEDAASVDIDAGFELDAGQDAGLDAAVDAGADAAPRGCYEPNPGGTPQCLADADCRLVDNCCDCMPLPVGEPERYCNPRITCLISRCALLGLGNAAVACISGHCVFAAQGCGGTVTCADPDPGCPGLSVPEVLDGCYTGRCLAPEECASVASCDLCTPSQACVTDETDATLHCVPIPPACAVDQSCGCMGATACGDLACCDDPSGLICYSEPNR